jgi:uncharacterized membrane protein
LIAFFCLFFIGSGPAEWGADSNIRFLSAVLFAVGYLIFFFIQLKGKGFKKDEREYLIELKASNATMIFILMYVFIFGISVYTIHEKDILMPASLIWFLAFTTVFFAYMVNSAFYLWFEKRVNGYGRN